MERRSLILGQGQRPKMLTKEQLKAAIPCEDYTDSFIDQIFGTIESGTLDDILAAPVDICDKIWILLREPWLNPTQLRTLAKQFYTDIEHLDATPETKSYRQMTLAASKGDLTDERFWDRDPEYMNKWREATSLESQMATLSGVWAALTVNSQAKALNLNEEDRKETLYLHRQWQMTAILETIDPNRYSEAF